MSLRGASEITLIGEPSTSGYMTTSRQRLASTAESTFLTRGHQWNYHLATHVAASQRPEISRGEPSRVPVLVEDTEAIDLDVGCSR
jgi:hypothetical protein